jgi:phage gp36-like protein
MAYATISDLEDSGLPPGALAGIAPEVVEKALTSASALADVYLRDRYTLPLAEPYDPVLVDAVVRIACWRLMSRRGFSPQSGTDTAMRVNYEDAMDLLKRVANGQAQLAAIQASPEAVEPMVLTSPARGYTEHAGIDGPVGPYEGGV